MHSEQRIDRLERAFFTPENDTQSARTPSKESKQKSNRAVKMQEPAAGAMSLPSDRKLNTAAPLIGAAAFLAVIIVILFLNGSLYIVPTIQGYPQSIQAGVKSYSFSPSGTYIRSTPSRVFMLLPALSKAALTIDLMTPVNLEQHRLWIPLHTAAAGFSGTLIAKDIHFHSNTFAPVTFAVPSGKNVPGGVLLNVSELLKEPSIDTKKVTQLKLSVDNTGTKTALIILEKNISLVKK